MSDGTIVINMNEPGAREYVHLAQLKGAIRLEKLGMKFRGGSAYATAKRMYGFKGDRDKVIEQIKKRMDEILAVRNEAN